MSKAPKQKKAQLHYAPYQSASNGDAGMDFGADFPGYLDPVLMGLPSSLSRNLWDDWNENDTNFQVKFDMFNDEVASTTSTAPSSVAAISPGAPSPSPHRHESRHEDAADKPREHVERSLSEDIVNMLDDGGDLVLTPNHARTANNAGHNGAGHGLVPSHAAGNANGSGTLNQHTSPLHHHPQLQRHQQHSQQRQQQQQSNQHPSQVQQQQEQQQQHPHQQHQQQSPFDQQMSNPQFQQFQQMQQMQLQHLQQQLQMQQQLHHMQQQQQQQQRGGGNNWMDSFTTSSSSAMSSGTKSSLENAVAAASSTLTAMPHGSSALYNGTTTTSSGLQRQASTGKQSSTNIPNDLPKPPSTPQQQFNMSPFGFQTSTDGGATPGRKRKAEADISMGDKLSDRTPETSSSTPGSAPSSTPETASSSSGTPTSNGLQQNGGAFANPAMMMPGFMMYPMQMMGNYNALGMSGMNMNLMQMGTMQMPMGMQVPVGMGMNGLPLGMASPGMTSVNGMQMGAMNMPGMPMGMGMNGGLPLGAMGMQMGMQMPTSMGLPVNPQSGASGDVEMASSSADGNGAPVPTPIAMRALQPKDAARAGGPGFVSIARKPEEPEVSSILKSLMEEEAKKKEKKLERNRDSARESRKKQQTYVETLENGIKRLQINRDLVVTYKWGVSGPGFGPLPCPNSPQMFDWKNRVQVVTGQSEAFANIQNPTTFRGLMHLNRQRRALAMRTDERARAVWKCFVAIGRQLAELRDRIMQVQLLRVFSQNTLAGELSEVLQLTADQKLQLQCLAQTAFNEEVVQMVALFKAFFALRNEAIRLNLMSPALEAYFRESCSVEQLHKLLQFSDTYRSVIEDAFASA